MQEYIKTENMNIIIHKNMLGCFNQDRQYYENDYIINESNLILLFSIELHSQGFINDDKIRNVFYQYKNKTLLRTPQTYYCKVNKTWYNNTSTFDIYFDCYNKLCDKKDISLNSLLIYLIKYLNKPKNYCKKFIFYEFFQSTLLNINTNNRLAVEMGLTNDILDFDSFCDFYFGILFPYECETEKRWDLEYQYKSYIEKSFENIDEKVLKYIISL